MTIRKRLLLATAITALVAFVLLAKWLRDDVKSRYHQILEESLTETAYMLAGIAAQQNTLTFAKSIHRALQTKFVAQIFELNKSAIDLRILATDTKGIVLFDSAGLAMGKDYSQWNDVYLALRGRYGARSSRDDPRYPRVSIKYVAAPVMQRDKIVGVVVAAKPSITLAQAIQATRDKILLALLLAFAGFVIFTFAITLWITRPLGALVRYVQTLREGGRPALPPLGKSEIRELGHEFELMRNQLDGRQYVENFASLMTHEFKSPLASILGAAEILAGDPADQSTRERFVANIAREAERMNLITQNMLALARLENQRQLENIEWVHVDELLNTLMQTYVEDARINLNTAPELRLKGNYFLLYQAITNLVENARDFTPLDGIISISAHTNGDAIIIEVKDTGVGVPAYAQNRVFEKFYSLERPHTSRKGTGLGLAFVREVAILHGGDVTLINNALIHESDTGDSHHSTGATARLMLRRTVSEPR